MSGSPSKYIGKLLKVPGTRPELWLSGLAALFYFYYSSHLSWLWMTTLCISVLLLNYVLLRYGIKYIRRRLLLRELRLGPEFSIAAALLLPGIVLLFWQGLLLLACLGLAFLGWLLVQAWRKRIGSFYTAFVGLLLFLLVSLSYHLLFMEERFLLFALYHYNRYRTLEILEKQNWQEQKNPDHKRYTLEQVDGRNLQIDLPKNMWLHDGRIAGFAYNIPEPGPVLAYISSSQQDPYSPPALGIYLLSPSPRTNKERQAEDFRHVIERSLGHRRQANEIKGVRYAGRQDLSLNSSNPTQGKPQKLKGIGYTYRDTISERKMRLWFLLSPPTHRPYLGYLISEELSLASSAHRPHSNIQWILERVHSKTNL